MIKKWQEVESSVISRFRYFPRKRILEIEFKSKNRYYYFDVPVNVYSEFKNTYSSGVFFNTRIKPYYQQTRIR